MRRRTEPSPRDEKSPIVLVIEIIKGKYAKQPFEHTPACILIARIAMAIRGSKKSARS